MGLTFKKSYVLDIGHGANYFDNSNTVSMWNGQQILVHWGAYVFLSAQVSLGDVDLCPGANDRILAHSISHTKVQHPTSPKTCFWDIQKVNRNTSLLFWVQIIVQNLNKFEDW